MNKSQIAELARKIHSSMYEPKGHAPIHQCHRCDEIAEFVERAIAESQAWMSVEEKLPEVGKEVLAGLFITATFYDGHTTCNFQHELQIWTGEKWISSDSGDECGATHWTYLPEPPAEWCCDGKQASGEDQHNPDCRYHHSNYEPQNSAPMKQPKGNENV